MSTNGKAQPKSICHFHSPKMEIQRSQNSRYRHALTEKIRQITLDDCRRMKNKTIYNTYTNNIRTLKSN